MDPVREPAALPDAIRGALGRGALENQLRRYLAEHALELTEAELVQLADVLIAAGGEIGDPHAWLRAALQRPEFAVARDDPRYVGWHLFVHGEFPTARARRRFNELRRAMPWLDEAERALVAAASTCGHRLTPESLWFLRRDYHEDGAPSDVVRWFRKDGAPRLMAFRGAETTDEDLARLLRDSRSWKVKSYPVGAGDLAELSGAEVLELQRAGVL